MRILKTTYNLSVRLKTLTTRLKTLTVFVLLSSALVHDSAHASVDLKDAGFAKEWIDVELGEPGARWSLKRVYRSRSLANGFFGFGWCSNLEARLRRTPDGGVGVRDCEAASEIRFLPQPQPQFQFHTRSAYASPHRPHERLTFRRGLFVRTFADGNSQTFSKSGRLLALTEMGSATVRFHYDSNGRLATIRHPNGEALVFKFDSKSDRIREIIFERPAQKPLQMKYEYQGEALVKVTNAWRNEYRHTYDALLNLKRIDYPDQTFEELTYDADRDWVTSFRDRDGCAETYAIHVREADPSRHTTVGVSKICHSTGGASPGGTSSGSHARTVTEAKFDFWYAHRPDKSTYLARYRVERDGDFQEIQLHPVHGNPIRIVRRERVLHLSYDENGRPASVHEEGVGRIEIRYRAAGGLESIASVEGPHVATRISHTLAMTAQLSFDPDSRPGRQTDTQRDSKERIK